jgi:hypothetical protein
MRLLRKRGGSKMEMSDKMEKYLGKSYKKPSKDFDEVLKDAANKSAKEQEVNKKAMGESEDGVGTMGLTNAYAPQTVGDIGQQPMRVGRSSPSMSSRQRSWNLGFVSDVLDAEGLLSGDLRREIALRLAKMG